MKRLTPEQVTNGYAKGCGAPNAQSLRKDHLQAREDVKRLAGALQARVNDCCTSADRCLFCVRDITLLSKVDP